MKNRTRISQHKNLTQITIIKFIAYQNDAQMANRSFKSLQNDCQMSREKLQSPKAISRSLSSSSLQFFTLLLTQIHTYTYIHMHHSQFTKYACRCPLIECIIITYNLIILIFLIIIINITTKSLYPLNGLGLLYNTLQLSNVTNSSKLSL